MIERHTQINFGDATEAASTIEVESVCHLFCNCNALGKSRHCSGLNASPFPHWYLKQIPWDVVTRVVDLKAFFFHNLVSPKKSSWVQRTNKRSILWIPLFPVLLIIGSVAFSIIFLLKSPTVITYKVGAHPLDCSLAAALVLVMMVIRFFRFL